ncbi:hypothetical protein [Streptomyces noursei]|uniref:hypothetical protein n=1 Tax=Streptomyces noursei TaxID=1971 RepID=UPI001F049D20|nr:hypothetical protein [Streptomyces noursei]
MLMFLFAELFSFLCFVGAGRGQGGGELGPERLTAVWAEEAFAEEPVDRFQEDLLAGPEGFGVLVEPVGVAVVDVVAVADEVRAVLAGLAEHPALAQGAADVGAQG